MKVLVANLGSTSFKFRLLDMTTEQELARGAADRLGAATSTAVFHYGSTRHVAVAPLADHAAAMEYFLTQLMTAGLTAQALGFKAVHARGLTGSVRVTPDVLAAMEAYEAVAPGHNPPYLHAMRSTLERWPTLPLVAVFETGFHSTIPRAQRSYAVPESWEQAGVRRWGFHGASHRWIAERTAILLRRGDLKIISCHLGGSSSLCAIASGRSVATSMGMSPQSGLPQNNRVGDFDIFAVPVLLNELNLTLPEVLATLSTQSGLLGLAGSNDLEEILQRAENGDLRAAHAVDVYVAAIRHYLGAYLVVLGGADVIVFTGGIGERSPYIRQRVCADLEWFGIKLDSVRNEAGAAERPLHDVVSRVQIWTMPTNEELIVARETWAVLQREGQA
jgi:acetate kinase